ncbi:hypothetical protein UY3_13450 [Chelonia mydas]|uniref:Uncharacterized protein n=1 Tax=Chelonia mydas TaxID=8469 RepID=M7AXF2_CHEMY|nr:hypothetical protein UY3_13450 [Chelonia mydas]
MAAIDRDACARRKAMMGTPWYGASTPEHGKGEQVEALTGYRGRGSVDHACQCTAKHARFPRVQNTAAAHHSKCKVRPNAPAWSPTEANGTESGIETKVIKVSATTNLQAFTPVTSRKSEEKQRTLTRRGISPQRATSCLKEIPVGQLASRYNNILSPPFVSPEEEETVTKSWRMELDEC